MNTQKQKANAKARSMDDRESSLKRYEQHQAEIRKLLKQIDTGLEKHDLKASGPGGHHWGYVGDLDHVEGQLRELRDFLMGTGEYQSEPTQHMIYNRQGKLVKVVIPDM